MGYVVDGLWCYSEAGMMTEDEWVLWTNLVEYAVGKAEGSRDGVDSILENVASDIINVSADP